MTIPWGVVEAWPVRAALAGGLVLLVGRVLIALTRSPAGRARVGWAAVAAALLVIPLSLGPAWLTVSYRSAEPPAAADGGTRRAPGDGGPGTAPVGDVPASAEAAEL